MNKKIAPAATALACALAVATAYAQAPSPGYNNRIPERVMTPNTVQTRIGTLDFVDGVPALETTRLVCDHLVDGKPDAASRMVRGGFKVYPLNRATNPPTMEFINGSKVAYNTVHANTFEFYRRRAIRSTVRRATG